MKTLHIHISVDNLQQSIRFYRSLFAAEPAVAKSDYAKWMLDDPRINFAISAHGLDAGIDHLGIQVETQDELKEVYARLKKAGQPVQEEGATTCCYAKSEKSWTTDPQGVAWETFQTHGDSTEYGTDLHLGPQKEYDSLPGTPTDVCGVPEQKWDARTPCCVSQGVFA